ncbi:MAG: sugar phosphate isomerase/epimerase, partial [Clostridia bacterium]|nr:sugar phosphate isomerase/epimerase [Clostridia bacterium]
FKNYRRFSSKSEELMALIKRFDSDSVCCCWDFGHAGLAFKEKQAEKILEFGKYIECTHVQDCGHGDDLHLPPYQGDVDWDKCMKALKSVGYNGDLTFEMVYGIVCDDMLMPFCTYLLSIAKSLKSFFN